MELKQLSITELSKSLSAKEISARECVSYFAQQIEVHNPTYNAFVALDIDRALNIAETIDTRRANNQYLGPLAGIPFGVKDLEDAQGFVTTRGSALYADTPKVERNSHMVECFTRAGAIVLGKTNTPEFGWKSETDNLIFGPTRNPYDLSRSSGGSSGGSAAAVSMGMIPFATGSDGGGSLRIPASACGIAGMKTTLGRVPSTSPLPSGWSDLAVGGPMAKSISDTALLLDLVVTDDGRDFRSQKRKFELWSQEISVPKSMPKVGYSHNLGYSPIDPEVSGVIQEALVKLEAAGIEIVVLDELFDKDPIDEFFTLTNAYYAKTLKGFITHPNYHLVTEGIREQVAKGLETSATEFLEAADLSFYMSRVLYQLFSEVDLLISPTTAGLPPKIGESPRIGDLEDPDWVKLTYPFNMTRSPAASICAGVSRSGVPVGLQIVGPYLGDLLVLSGAKLFEDIFGRVTPEEF